MFVSGYSADMIALFPLIARAFRYNSVARSLAFGVQRQGMLLKGLVKDDFRYNLLSRYCKTVRPHLLYTRTNNCTISRDGRSLSGYN